MLITMPYTDNIKRVQVITSSFETPKISKKKNYEEIHQSLFTHINFN